MNKVLIIALAALLLPNPALGKWNYPVIKTGSKCGVHALTPGKTSEWEMQLASKGAQLPVLKGVDGITYVIAAKKKYPSITSVCRLITPHDACPGCHHNGTNFTDVALDVFKMVDKKIKLTEGAKEYCDFWELQNEPLGGGTPVWQYVNLASFMDALMVQANKRGLKLLMFTFNRGTPEWNDMVAIVNTGVFGRMRAGGHALAVHEGVFGSDPIDKWWNQTIPGSPHVPGAGALVFRYRYWFYLLRPRNEMVGVITSEFYIGGGYHNPQDAAKRVSWVDSQATLDYNSIGFTPFTSAPTPGWKNSDYDNDYEQRGGLLDHIVATKSQHNTLPPQSQGQVDE